MAKKMTEQTEVKVEEVVVELTEEKSWADGRVERQRKYGDTSVIDYDHRFETPPEGCVFVEAIEDGVYLNLSNKVKSLFKKKEKEEKPVEVPPAL